MKTRPVPLAYPVALFILFCWLGSFPSAIAQGTAFIYQGRLAQGGTPANGQYDLRFILYNSDVGGSQIGSILTNANIPVINGLFTTTLNFGSTFDGNPRWLEIAVRTNGSTGGFTLLDPRQPVTATPYAIHAANAANLTGTLPATSLTGTVPDPLLSANVPLLNANQTFTGTANFSPLSGPPFTVGSTNKVTSLNADLLDGLDSAAFSPASHNHFGQNWSGAAPNGLNIENSFGAGVIGYSSVSNGGFPGVLGQSASTGGRGVVGIASALNGNTIGVYGRSDSSSGKGIYGEANGTGTNYGIYGFNTSSNGYGVYAENSATNGAAFRAAGSGIIQSSADSYFFVSPNFLIKQIPSDPMVIYHNANGTSVQGGSTGNKTVHLPLTLPAVFYGQNVGLVDVTVYYKCAITNSFISQTSLLKTPDASNFQVLFSDGTDQNSTVAASYTVAPSGGVHYLSSSAGALHMQFVIFFASGTDTVSFAGVRVRLRHY